MARSLSTPFNAGAGNLILTVLALTSIFRGLCYLPAVVPPSHRIPALDHLAPLEVWASVWVIGGGVALVGVFCDRVSNIGVGIVAGLHGLWGTLYLLAFLFGESQRGYVTSLSFFTIAFLVIACFTRFDRDQILEWSKPGVSDG